LLYISESENQYQLIWATTLSRAKESRDWRIWYALGDSTIDLFLSVLNGQNSERKKESYLLV